MVKSLYIHIPFCNEICSYCDFPKVFLKGQDVNGYVEALITELKIYEKTLDFSDLQTIYIGGGTPTVLTIATLDKLFTYLHSVINFHQLVEVSIEANPESLTDPQKVAYLKRSGVTRISLGVQTFQEPYLQILNRSHSKKDVFKAINLLAAKNFEINLDMIYAIPTQTLAAWEADLNSLLQLPITHLSAYSLILESHTKLHLDYLNDKLQLIDNEVEAQMFELAINKLTNASFKHYEISNFTKNKPSSHNLTYWQNEDYLGVGLGAHGALARLPATEITKKAPKAPPKIRYENTRAITTYQQALKNDKLPIINSATLTINEQLEESMFLGMRLLAGVNLHELQNKYQVNLAELYKPKLDKLRKLAYVHQEAGILKLTPKGLLMANDVFAEFLL